MKKITIIFLLLFSLVHVVPAFLLHFETTSVCITEEKNGKEKNENAENKDQKYFSQFAKIYGGFSHYLNTAFQVAEKTYSSPYLEKLTPPPNFT